MLFGAYESKQYAWEHRDINILWVGTSIPMGTPKGDYPSMVDELLGDSVHIYNIGKSGSIASVGNHNFVTPEDVNGMGGYKNNIVYLMKSLGLSQAEKKDILDNWDTWKDFFEYTITFDTILTPEKQDLWMACSYDGDMKYYLENYHIDYVVYDMGYNDADVYGAPDTDDIMQIPPQHDDRTYYLGASEFIFNKIHEYSPDTEIIIAGHYSKDDRPYLWQAQEKLAEYMDVPIYKPYEKTGWTTETVKTTGYWQDGYWVPEGGPEQELTIIEMWCPDGTHPGNDLSQKANRYLAEIHAEGLREIIY